MQTEPADADLVLLARAGDREALAAIYDRYADRIFDLCSSVLRDPDGAFDTTVDTFVLAALEIYRLRKPAKLEAWLFALTREQLLSRKIPLGVDQHAEFDGPTGAATAVGAGAIVWEAVSWFPPRDRVLLELHARQAFDDVTLANILGVSPPHAVGLVRDLDERVERLISALLVARLSRPGCPPLERLIASEDEDHPDAWLRHVALHVDVCRTCLLWREDQPSAIQLIKDVPAEPAPPDARDEVLDRIDLLWSQLGPPEWSASIAAGEQPAEKAIDEMAETALLPAETSAQTTDEPSDETTEATSAETTEETPDETTEETGDETTEVIDEGVAPGEEPGKEVAAAAGDETEGSREPVDSEGHGADEFDEVESLLPPPPRFRRNGFPRRPMYPRRRRRVLVGGLLVIGLITAAIVLNFRGFGPSTDRLYRAEARAAARNAPATTAPPTTATTAPPTTAGPDTRPPFVFNLATVYGCIGPKQGTTTALASVVDPPPGRIASVELVFVDASGTETRRPMTRSGGEFEAPIGPYAVDGNITWEVIGADEVGNSARASGPSVAASSSC